MHAQRRLQLPQVAGPPPRRRHRRREAHVPNELPQLRRGLGGGRRRERGGREARRVAGRVLRLGADERQILAILKKDSAPPTEEEDAEIEDEDLEECFSTCPNGPAGCVVQGPKGCILSCKEKCIDKMVADVDVEDEDED